jgi:hypothetical protein
MNHQNAFWLQTDTAVKQPARFPRILFQWERQSRAQRNWRKILARAEQGEFLVSFALSFPILFGFIFGLMQVCLALYSHEYISELAREGARYAIVHGPDCLSSGGASCEVTATTGAGSYPSVNSYVSGIGFPNLGGGTVIVSTTYPNGEAVSEPVLVKVTYVFPYHLPFITSSSLSMSSTSEMNIIQ